MTGGRSDGSWDGLGLCSTCRLCGISPRFPAVEWDEKEGLGHLGGTRIRDCRGEVKSKTGFGFKRVLARGQEILFMADEWPGKHSGGRWALFTFGRRIWGFAVW